MKKSAKKLAQKGVKAAKTALKDGAMIEKIGAMVENRVAKAVKSKKVGKLAGNLVTKVPKLIGMGDYQLASNSLFSSGGVVSGVEVPKFVSKGRGTRITETEFVCNIYGTSSFTNNTFNITPTDPSSFPWLSLFAANFDEYEPHGIVYHFKSTSSEYNGSSQALGKVIMSVDYDSLDPAYASSVEAENSDHAVACKPSCNIVAGVECSPNERPTRVLYTGAVPSVRDPRLYLLGTMQVCTEGLNSAVVVGELWVSYDITFYKKQVSVPGRSFIIIFTGVAGQNASNPFGAAPNTTPSYSSYNNYQPAAWGLAASNQLTFANVSGDFTFYIEVIGTGVTALSVAAPNASAVITSTSSNSTSTTGQEIMGTVQIRPSVTNYTTNPPIITLNITATTVTKCRVYVSAVGTNQGPIN